MMDKIMEMAKKLEGMRTVESVQRSLNVSRRTAINYISKLRKEGLVITQYSSNKKRLYIIRPSGIKLKGYPGIYDVINKYSRIKLAARHDYRIHDHRLTVEETIVRAIKTKGFRVILASMDLFNKVEDWTLLNRLAKEYNVTRKVGALYDVARTIVRVRRMPENIRKSLLHGKVDSKHFTEYKIKTKEEGFKNIAKLWRVEILFRKADLMKYKEWSKS